MKLNLSNCVNKIMTQSGIEVYKIGILSCKIL